MGKRIYTVHARAWSAQADADAVFVREGFNWAAALFGPFWALWHGMWRTAIGLFVVSALLSVVVILSGAGPDADTALTFAVQFAIGLWANDWRRYALRRAGYVERAVISGARMSDAEMRYFAGRA